MSYLVLARKWRPSRFGDLVGQEHVARTLENAIRQDRVAHAYLFTGPRGVGKTSTARILAAALNCDKGPTPEPCGECGCCKEVAAGRSLDVLEIDGASNRGIDEIRDLRESVRYMASAGKRKIYIIDEVHMLTGEAFNALLKTLEEPPSHVLFVFATTRPTKVPTTILSRVIRFDFRRIDAKAIVGRLKMITGAEKIEADEKALHLVARAADGSMRDALSLLEQARAYGGGRLVAGETEEALGVVDDAQLFAISKAAREGDTLAAMETVNEMVNRGRDPLDFLLALEEHFRDLLVARVSKNPEGLIDAAEETIALYKEEAGRFEPDDLIRMLTLLGEGAREMRFSPKPRLVLEMLLLRLVRMDSTVPLAEILSRLSKGTPAPAAAHRKPAAPPAPPGPVVPPKPPAPARTAAPRKKKAAGSKAPAPTDADPRLFKSRWGEFVEHLRKESPSLASLLDGALPGKATPDAFEIAFPKGATFQMEQALGRENKEELEQVFSGFFRSPRRIRGTLGSHTMETARDKKTAIKDDPRIGRLLDALDGEIL
ncbi:MAG: DNA polymerase III subunit gamma/tau [Candidatus Eisenbacteria bacterium]